MFSTIYFGPGNHGDHYPSSSPCSSTKSSPPSSQATMETIMACLPTRRQAIIAAATGKVLGSFSTDEVNIGKHLSSINHHFYLHLIILVIIFIIISHHHPQVYISDTPSWMFGEEEPRVIFEKFRNSLGAIELQISARNEKLRVPYTILMPSRIPAGISI